jgi:hypothetical protein
MRSTIARDPRLIGRAGVRLNDFEKQNHSLTYLKWQQKTGTNCSCFFIDYTTYFIPNKE